MKIHLIVRIRNEADIIADSIRHWKGFVTGEMIFYDDCSTDDTPKIIKEMGGTVVQGTVFHKDRDFSEFYCREQALKALRPLAKKGDWVVYADADERLELDWGFLNKVPDNKNAIAVRLFDYYITPEDEDKGWESRKWIGPEYRDIVMIWRHDPNIIFNVSSARVPTIPNLSIIQYGFCHHYGKSRSIEAWEEKCKYYQGVFSGSPKVKAKWKFREGKAVKRDYMSDFKHPLLKWEDRNKRGFPLTQEVHKREFT